MIEELEIRLRGKIKGTQQMLDKLADMGEGEGDFAHDLRITLFAYISVLAMIPKVEKEIKTN